MNIESLHQELVDSSRSSDVQPTISNKASDSDIQEGRISGHCHTIFKATSIKPVSKENCFWQSCRRNFAALPNCKLNLFYAFYAFVFKRKHTQVRKHGRPFIIHLIIAKTILAGLSPCLGSDIFCQIGVGAVVCVMCMPRIDLKLLSLLLL